MTSTPPPPARQARSRRSRQALLDAGLQVLAEDGLEALTIAAVSARAGLAAGTVYRRFGGREGLVVGLQAQFTADLKEEFDVRLDPSALPAGVSPRTAIDLAVRALADTFRRHERLLAEFIRLGMSDPRVQEEGARASREGAGQFRDLLWSQRGAFTAGDPARAIGVVHQMVYGLLVHRVLRGEHPESSVQLSWEELTDELSRTATLYLLGVVPPGRGVDSGRM